VNPDPVLDRWRQGVMQQMLSWPFYEPLDALRGNVPGTFLNSVSLIGSPETFA
jgi:hypothetical protein